MKNRRHLAVLVCIGSMFCVGYALVWLCSPSQRFAREPESLYVALVNTCKSLLDHADLATNRVVWLDPKAAALPVLTMRYKPRTVAVLKDRVELSFDGGRYSRGFSVIWARTETNSRLWELQLFDGARDIMLLREERGNPDAVSTSNKRNHICQPMTERHDRLSP